MNQDESLPSMSSVETEQLVAYRSISALAVSSFLLGLISVAALAHPTAWFIPLLTAATAIAALARIAHHSDTLQGRRLAIIALTLGLFFAACAPSRYFADRWIVRQKARDFSSQWLQDVRDGKLNLAHQAVLSARSRQPEGTLLDEFYQQHEQARLDREAYFAKDVPQRIRQLGSDVQIQFERTMSLIFERRAAFVTQRYWLTPRDNPAAKLHIQTESMREQDEYGVYWTLIAVDDADEFDRTHPRH